MIREECACAAGVHVHNMLFAIELLEMLVEEGEKKDDGMKASATLPRRAQAEMMMNDDGRRTGCNQLVRGREKRRRKPV